MLIFWVFSIKIGFFCDPFKNGRVSAVFTSAWLGGWNSMAKKAIILCFSIMFFSCRLYNSQTSSIRTFYDSKSLKKRQRIILVKKESQNVHFYVSIVQKVFFLKSDKKVIFLCQTDFNCCAISRIPIQSSCVKKSAFCMVWLSRYWENSVVKLPKVVPYWWVYLKFSKKIGVLKKNTSWFFTIYTPLWCFSPILKSLGVKIDFWD